MSSSPRTFIALDRLRASAQRWPVTSALAALIFAVVLVYLPPPYGWLLLVGGAIVGMTLVEPLAGLYMLPFVVAFGSLFTVTVHGLNAGPTDLLVAALAISTLGHGALRSRSPGRERLLTTPGLARVIGDAWKRDRWLMLTLAAFLLYLLVIALSVLVAASKSLALKEGIKWTEVLVLLAVAVSVIRSVRDIHIVAWAIIGAGVGQALLGYWQWVQVTGSHSASATSLRVFGTFGQPNPYAGYLNFALLLSLSLLLFTRRWAERWIAGAAAAVIAFAMLLADSRGAELGLAVAIIVMLIVASRLERPAGVALLIGVPVVAIAWLLHIVPGRLRVAVAQQVTIGPVNSANFSVQERLAHWVAGLRMFRAHPLLGVGAGNYSEVYAHYQVSPDWFEALGHAHNYYINAAAETGILGLLAFLSLVGVSLYAGWRAVRRQEKTARLGWGLALGFLAVLVAFHVHNLTDDLFVHAMELQLALSVACLLCLLRLSSAPPAGGDPSDHARLQPGASNQMTTARPL